MLNKDKLLSTAAWATLVLATSAGMYTFCDDINNSESWLEPSGNWTYDPIDSALTSISNIFNVAGDALFRFGEAYGFLGGLWVMGMLMFPWRDYGYADHYYSPPPQPKPSIVSKFTDFTKAAGETCAAFANQKINETRIAIPNIASKFKSYGKNVCQWAAGSAKQMLTAEFAASAGLGFLTKYAIHTGFFAAAATAAPTAASILIPAAFAGAVSGGVLKTLRTYADVRKGKQQRVDVSYRAAFFQGAFIGVFGCMAGSSLHFLVPDSVLKELATNFGFGHHAAPSPVTAPPPSILAPALSHPLLPTHVPSAPATIATHATAPAAHAAQSTHHTPMPAAVSTVINQPIDPKADLMKTVGDMNSETREKILHATTGKQIMGAYADAVRELFTEGKKKAAAALAFNGVTFADTHNIYTHSSTVVRNDLAFFKNLHSLHGYFSGLKSLQSAPA